MPLKQALQVIGAIIISVATGFAMRSTLPTDTCTRAALDDVLNGGQLVLADDCVLMVSPAAVVTGDVVIEGGMLHSNGVDRILIVEEGANLTLRNAQVLSGSIEIEPAIGGAILNHGQLTLETVKISANSAQQGGGIYNAASGVLFVIDSELARNRAREGGAIYNRGMMMITGSMIDDNRAMRNGNYGGYGAGIVNKGLAVILTSQITNNRGDGEGIGIDTSGSLTIRQSVIMGNQCMRGDCRGTGVLRFEGMINVQHNYWGSDDGPSEDGNGSGDGIINIAPHQVEPFLTEPPDWYKE